MNLFQTDGFREIDFTLDESAIQELNRRWKSFMDSVPNYPQNTYSGKGVVICGGGEYFICAWVTIKYLKLIKCTLPIELWYVGNELNEAHILEMQKMGIQCKNLADCNRDYANLRGYIVKPLCIMNSSFEEILFIDADNLCLSNPESLFSSIQYQDTGAIFWPDYWKTAVDNPIWEIMGIQYSESPEQESGQLLINKKKCWEALQLCIHLNLNHKVYHKLLLGDKDTFRFSWMGLHQDFYMVTKQPDACGYIDEQNIFRGITMIQYDINGKTPLFLHRNLVKWSHTNDNKKRWQKIKRFKNNSKEARIFIGYSANNGHNFIDFIDGYEIFDFNDEFEDTEDICLQFLAELRSKELYKPLTFRKKPDRKP